MELIWDLVLDLRIVVRNTSQEQGNIQYPHILLWMIKNVSAVQMLDGLGVYMTVFGLSQKLSTIHGTISHQRNT